MLGAPGQGQNPRAIDKRRLMPNVLPMTTCQISHPVAIFILVISDDRLFHIVMKAKTTKKRIGYSRAVIDGSFGLRQG